MARRGWFDIGEVIPRGRREQRQGLVLSGGGAKGAFQIGALRYLYANADLAPEVIVGTSAGSILAAMLAQSADREEQAAMVGQMEDVWMRMTQQSDMFTEREWFRRFRQRGPEILTLLQREGGRDTVGVVRRLPRISLPFTKGFQLDPDDEQTPDDEARSEPEGTLSPELETLALATTDPAIVAPDLTASQVMTVVAGLGRMRGVGTDLGIVLKGAQSTRSMYVPGPILQELLGSGMFTSRKVADSGVTTRIAMVALESGELRFMRQDGVLVDRDDVELGVDPEEFSRGVLASCSIPAVFKPVELGGEYCIDGGVRENLPVEMAMGPLGCTTTWVVSCNAPSVGRRESFADKDMFSIVMRASEIQSDESERDEMAWARSAGATIVEPEIDIHDALTVDPGLLWINHAYGWMRAAEVHREATVDDQALNRDIIQARRRAWELERDILDPRRPHDERELLLLARLKYDLREQVSRQRVELLPDGSEGWWTTWEGHPTAPTAPPPWMV